MIARLAGISLVLLLVACSTSAPVPEDRFYELTPRLLTTLPHAYLKGGLSIAHVVADPLRSGRAVLYRDARRPLELRRYHYEFWAEQPPQMIQHTLLNSLRHSGVADRVESEGRHPHFRYELDVTLRHFESLAEADRSLADIALEVAFRKAGSGDLVWTKIYRRQVDARPGDIHALADAMQQGLEWIIEQLSGDLKVAGTNDS